MFANLSKRLFKINHWCLLNFIPTLDSMPWTGYVLLHTWHHALLVVFQWSDSFSHFSKSPVHSFAFSNTYHKPIGLQEICFNNMNKQVHCKLIHPPFREEEGKEWVCRECYWQMLLFLCLSSLSWKFQSSRSASLSAYLHCYLHSWLLLETDGAVQKAYAWADTRE